MNYKSTFTITHLEGSYEDYTSLLGFTKELGNDYSIRLHQESSNEVVIEVIGNEDDTDALRTQWNREGVIYSDSLDTDWDELY